MIMKMAPLEQLKIPCASTRMDNALEDTLVITFLCGDVIRVTIDQKSEHYTIWTEEEIPLRDWEACLDIIGNGIRIANNRFTAVGLAKMLDDVGLELPQ